MRRNKGCSSYLIIIIIAFVAAYWIAGFSDDSAISTDGFDNTSTLYPDNGSDSGAVNDSGFNTADCKYYDQLNDDEKYIYRVFLQGIENGNLNFEFNNVDYETYNDYAFKAICALTYDYPEYFWLECGYTYSFSHAPFSTNGTVEIKLSNYDFWDYSLSKDQRIAELESAVNRVATMALTQSSDFDRIKFVHDYLVENAIYDHDALDEYFKTYHDASCEYIFTAYGCLVKQKTVCAGYAKAFKLIMEKMGYECLYVTGYAGEAHAWNLVFIGDEGYYIDITWDDADFEDGEVPVYDYFGISTDYLERTHTIDTDFAIPECTSREYDYFYYTDKHLDYYDFESAKAIIEAQKYDELISIRFGSYSEFKRACDDLLTDQMICYIEPYTNASSYRYRLNDKQFIIELFP